MYSFWHQRQIFVLNVGLPDSVTVLWLIIHAGKGIYSSAENTLISYWRLFYLTNYMSFGSPLIGILLNKIYFYPLG